MILFTKIFLRKYIIKPPKYFCDLIKIFLTEIKIDPKLASLAHCAMPMPHKITTILWATYKQATPSWGG